MCVHTPAWLPQTATQAAVPFLSAAFTPTFSSGKRLHPSLALHNSSRHECAMRHTPLWAHLIWIKDVFWFRFIRQGRTCITQSWAADPCVCLNQTVTQTVSHYESSASLWLSICAIKLRNTELTCQASTFLQQPLTATRYGQIGKPGGHLCLLAAKPASCSCPASARCHQDHSNSVRSRARAERSQLKYNQWFLSCQYFD